MKLVELGDLAGEVLLFGGPYSNLEAMRALIAEAARRGIPASRAICTGDLAAYGADAAATVAAFRDWGAVLVAGNCERQLAEGAADCGCGFDAGSACDLLSRGWYPHALAALDPAARAWLGDAPDMVLFTHAGRRYAVIHGGLTDVSRFLWPSSDAAAFAEEVAAIRAAAGPVDAVVAGHSGIAFQRRVAGVDWINAGAIGLPPHDGRPETRFAVLGAEGARICRLSYDHVGAARAMRAAGLVQGYERALETGLWPSEDVLPAELRR